MSTTLLLAWRNLWRHQRRTWLTIGAMIFSNVLLVFLITIQFGSYDMMIENSLKAFSGHIQIAQAGYHQDAKMRQSLNEINSLEEQIQQAYPELNLAARASTIVLASSKERSLGIQIMGVNPKGETLVSSVPGLIKQGAYFRDNIGDKIILSHILARNLKAQLGDEITLLGSGLDGSFAASVVVVVGIFESGFDGLDRSVAQVPLRTFQSIFSMEDSGHSIIINVPEINLSQKYQQELKQLFLAQPELEILTWEQRHPEIKQAIQTDMASAWFMYVVLIVLVAFSVLNTQLMTVLERTREFGIMLAIGVRASRLARLIFMETTLMAAIGFILGSGVGLIVVAIINQTGFSFPGMEEMAAQYNLSEKMYPSLSPLAIFLGPSIVFAGCLLTSIYPALRLFLLEPVSAMRAA